MCSSDLRQRSRSPTSSAPSTSAPSAIAGRASAARTSTPSTRPSSRRARSRRPWWSTRSSAPPSGRRAATAQINPVNGSPAARGSEIDRASSSPGVNTRGLDPTATGVGWSSHGPSPQPDRTTPDQTMEHRASAVGGSFVNERTPTKSSSPSSTANAPLTLSGALGSAPRNQ